MDGQEQHPEHHADSANDDAKPEQTESPPKKRRDICMRCDRPTPRACICPALPERNAPITLQNCRFVVLQHPQERKKHFRNGSLRLVELCMETHRKDDANTQQNESDETAGADKANKRKRTTSPGFYSVGGSSQEDAPLHVVVARRFGDQTPDHIRALIQPASSSSQVWLVFPSQEPEDSNATKTLVQAISGIQNTEARESKDSSNNTACEPDSASDKIDEKVTIILLDATWKYANEMHRANLQHKQYPSNMTIVSLQPQDEEEKALVGIGSNKVNQAVSNEHDATSTVWSSYARGESRTSRFSDIRTAPTPDCLSTAECLAWVASAIEQNGADVYQALIKPLDFLVAQVRACRDAAGNDERRREHREGKGNFRKFSRHKQNAKRAKTH